MKQNLNRSSAGRTAQQQSHKLVVKVVDETGVAVPSALITLAQVGTPTTYKGETDYAGRFEFAGLTPGVYQLQVAKEDFYVATLNDVRVGEIDGLSITLNHQQEIAETVNVYDSPPAIDPAKTEVSDTLSSQEIVNVPYPSTRDVRKALPLIPGVVADPTGQVHVDGSSTYQIFDQLDGFNITQPVTGLLELRVSADAVRSIEVQSSRYSAQYGKGSGGILSLATGMGDDRYRFSATNFIPSLQNRKGVNINEWTPRATVSGPLRKKKAWFYEAVDGEYNLKIFDELPAGADRNPSWRVSNLAKAQVNLSQRNILTTSFLINRFHSKYAGLSPFNPLETTLNQRQSAYLFTVKDQTYFSNGMLLEIGAGANQYRTNDLPYGSLPYLVRPEGTSGNYFKTEEDRARRLQVIANLTMPAIQWHGRHEFRIGLDINRIAFDQFAQRQPISILQENGTLSRKITFLGTPRFRQNNTELGGYAQDRWSVSDRLLLETGVRLDRDQIIDRPLVSPRLSSTYLLTEDGNTKISMGAGLFYDATNLDFITRPLVGQRFDLLYGPGGERSRHSPSRLHFKQTNET